MGLRCCWSWRCVAQPPNPFAAASIIFAKKNDLVPVILGQVWCKVAELARCVLMDKKNSQ